MGCYPGTGSFLCQLVEVMLGVGFPVLIPDFTLYVSSQIWDKHGRYSPVGMELSKGKYLQAEFCHCHHLDFDSGLTHVFVV